MRVRPLRILQIAVTASALALLWHLADGRAALAHLAGMRPAWLAAALAALTAQTLLSALRWRLTAAQLGITLGRRRAVREYYLSQIVNAALPGGVLGDAGRAVRARAQAGLVASGQAVLFERVAGQLALYLIFATAVVATLLVPGGVTWPERLWLPVIGGVAGTAAALWILQRVGPHLPGRAGPALARLGGAFQRALWAPDVRVRQVLMSVGTALLNVAAFGCCAAAIGLALPPAAALVLVPPILLTMLVPLTVSGWGLREGAAAALLPLAGATAAQGLAASVAFGLAMLVAALPGACAAGLAMGRGAAQS